MDVNRDALKFEEATENIIFICRKCHCRIRGGKNVLKTFEEHEKICDCNKGYDYVMPGDKHYNYIKTYSAN
jgi:NADH:ubiquinone oxidoreductase subunit E